MKTIGSEKENQSVSALSGFTNDQPSENKAPHKRAFYVEKTRKALGEKPDGSEYTFGHINGASSHLTVKQLRDRYHECKKADIPFAPLWWWKRNQDKKQ